MAHFAKIEDGLVVDVIVVSDEHEENGQEYIASLGVEGTWIQTSYNGNIRGKYAYIGDTYDAENDVFITPVAEAVLEEGIVLELTVEPSPEEVTAPEAVADTE